MDKLCFQKYVYFHSAWLAIYVVKNMYTYGFTRYF